MREKSEVLSNIFDDFVKNYNREDYYRFDSFYIYNHKLWKWNNKVGLRPYLIESGINPDCVFSSKRGFYKNNKSFLNNIINELSIILGRENINSGSMDSNEEIEPPKSLQTKGNFKRTDETNFPLKKIKLSNIQISICRTFNCSWNEILLLTDNKSIIRKKYKNSLKDVLINYQNYKKKYKIFSYTSLLQFEIRKRNPSLWKQILKIGNKLNIKINYSDFFIGIVSLEHFEKVGELPNKEFLISRKIENDFKEFLLNQNDIKWEKYPEILQDIVLEMYVKGSSIYRDDNKTDIERKVTDKIRHWKGKKSKDVYKNSGIIIDKLQNIKSIIDSKYNRKDIYDKFRELMKKTIESGINHLSREYIEKNEKEFMNSCFKVERIKSNNWGRVLELYGINGELFLPDRLDVSNRGVKFENLIKDLFDNYLVLKNNKSELNDKLDFWYKKKQGNIIPDFTFIDKIIDTKFSIGYSKDDFHHNQIIQQIKKYHKTKKEIIILTFNQKDDEVNFDGKTTKIINLKSLRGFLKINFGVIIDDIDIKYIFEEINKIKFFRRYN